MRVQRSACHFAAPGVVLLLGLAAPLFGQFNVRQSTPNSPAQREMQAREWALTHVSDEVDKHFKKEQISLFAQIREDFTRLQLINNEMMQTVFVKRSVDLKLIAATSAEINKRATRLSETLVLPRLDNKAKNQKPDDPGNDSGLQAGLLALDRCIMSFIANPLFKQPNVVDAQLALKARRDLDLIIRLSKQLKTGLGDQYKDSTSLVTHLPAP
jgi:uncharacterized membrane-anchored protein YhcB (DUF1043 family)